MSDSSTATAQKSGGLVKKLGIAFGVVLVLLVAGYFVATSSGFLKSVILPRASTAIGATVDAEAIELSPFSQVTIRGLKVSTPGNTEPLLSSASVRASYDLMAIIGGTIRVSEVRIDSPKITLQFNPDGTSSLTPILNTLNSGSKPSPAPAGSKAPPVLDIGSLRIDKAELVYLKRMTNGTQDRITASGVDLVIGPIKNGQPIQVELAASVGAQLAGGPAPAKPGNLEATIKTKLSVTLDPQFQPLSATASTFTLDVTQAGGTLGDLKGLGANLGLDWTPAEVKQLALKFSKSGQALGEILAQGPFKALQQEGRLTVIVRGIGPDVLKLATASSGIDLGQLALGTTNTIEMSNGGRNISVEGSLAGTQLTLTHPSFKSPLINFALSYQAGLDQSNRQAQVRSLSAVVTQGARPLARVALAQPMTLDWGTGGGAPAESSLQVSVESLQLSDWTPATLTNAPRGRLDLQVAVQTRKAGKEITFNANLGVVELTGISSDKSVPPASLQVVAAGSVSQFKNIGITNLSVDFSDRSGQLVQINGSANFDTATQAADAKIDLSSLLAKLGPWIPVPELKIQSGLAKMAVDFAQKPVSAAVGTNAAVFQRTIRLASTTDDLNVRYQDIALNGWSKQATLDAQLDGDLLVIKQMQAQVKPSPTSTATGVEVSGRYDLKKSAGSISAIFSRLSQDLIRPLLAGSPMATNLVSAELNGRVQAEFQGAAGANFTGAMGLTNLVVKTTTSPSGTTPMGAGVQFDAGSTGTVHAIRSLKLALGPTARATRNELELKGQVQIIQTNKIQGKLDISSDAIDLTSWYNVFVADTPADASKDSSQAATNKPAGPATEPKGMQTPLQPFAVNVAIGKFFLGDIGISNLVLQSEVNGGKVSVKPARFVMNQVTNDFSAALDLGVDGYIYDVVLNAPGIPLEPFANTFTPKFRGQLQGDLFVNGSIKGAGTTGVNLRRSLQGGLQASVTNANLQIVGPKTRMILTPIAFALRLNELLKSPLQGLDVRTEFGQGQIRLRQMAVLSELFKAEGTGTIPIADDLNQSPLNIPVNFSLNRALAQKSNLLPPNTPTNQTLVALPKFATVKGTLGTPSTDIDKLVISGLLLRSTAAIPGLAGEKAGNILQGLGNLLTGPGEKQPEQPQAAPAATPTPAPATQPQQPSVKPAPQAVPVPSPATPVAPKPSATQPLTTPVPVAAPKPAAPTAPAQAPAPAPTSPQPNAAPASQPQPQTGTGNAAQPQKRPSLLQQLPGIILTNRNLLRTGEATNKPAATATSTNKPATTPAPAPAPAAPPAPAPAVPKQ